MKLKQSNNNWGELMPILLTEILVFAAAVLEIAIILGIVAGMIYSLVVIIRIGKPNKRQSAIRLYARQLGGLLQSKYGKQQTYSPTQVKATMTEWGYNNGDDCYGLAMYCDRDSFMEYHRAIGESCNYDAMRGEISLCLFNNVDTSFSTDSLANTDFGSNSFVSDDPTRNEHYHGGHSYDNSGHHSHHDYGGHSGGGDYGGGHH
jgi:hypothetical protein